MDSRSHTSSINALNASLDSHMAIYGEKEEYLLAAALDCRFKLRWCKDASEIANANIRGYCFLCIYIFFMTMNFVVIFSI